jgi:hypothetical protein
MDSLESMDPLRPRVSKRKEEYPKCLSDYTKSTYPCKLKYAVFDDMDEYRKYLLFIHERKLEREDYHHEIPNYYSQLRQNGIPISERRKKTRSRGSV